MRTGSFDSTHPAAERDVGGGETAGRAVLTGAMPLILLAVVVALTIGVAALARTLAAPVGYFTWEVIVITIVVIGLVAAAVVYTIATARALRRAAAWGRAGLSRQAASVYWTLFVAAIIVLAPLILALVIPQHPAPPRGP